MKKIIGYLQWLPFALCFGSLLTYIIYTVRIKLNPSIIVTDKLISTLKLYLLIALISLFVGLFIVLIKKIYYLTKSDNIYKPKKIIKDNKNQEKIIVVEEKINKEKDVLCPECNLKISKNAAICPHCGILFDKKIIKVLNKYEKGKRRIKPLVLIANILLIIIFLFLIFLISNKLIIKYNENQSKINPTSHLN